MTLSLPSSIKTPSPKPNARSTLSNEHANLFTSEIAIFIPVSYLSKINIHLDSSPSPQKVLFCGISPPKSPKNVPPKSQSMSSLDESSLFLDVSEIVPTNLNPKDTKITPISPNLYTYIVEKFGVLCESRKSISFNFPSAKSTTLQLPDLSLSQPLQITTTTKLELEFENTRSSSFSSSSTSSASSPTRTIAINDSSHRPLQIIRAKKPNSNSIDYHPLEVTIQQVLTYSYYMRRTSSTSPSTTTKLLYASWTTPSNLLRSLKKTLVEKFNLSDSYEARFWVSRSSLYEEIGHAPAAGGDSYEVLRVEDEDEGVNHPKSSPMSIIVELFNTKTVKIDDFLRLSSRKGMELGNRLSKGDNLDAFDGSNWYEAVVVGCNVGEVKIHFFGWSKKFDSKVKRSSATLAPLWTHVSPWRSKLKVGDTVEVRDISCPRVWTSATVLRVENDTIQVHAHNITLTTIASCATNYHLFDRHIDKPLACLHTESSSFWISIYSEHLAQKNTHIREKIKRESSLREITGPPKLPSSVGFVNLGHTCYMNSILQILLHLPCLREYFANGAKLEADLNLKNPIGFGGRAAVAVSQLFEKYHSNDFMVIEPSAFKRTINQLAPVFSNTGQHDAEEFMTFILDAIHEDTNRVMEKPYVLDEDYFGVDSQVACEDALAKHKLRNNSIISENFMGMFRCTTMCSVCNKEAVKFEPFTTLRLEIPQDQEGTVDIKDCLDYHTNSEVVDGTNSWLCSTCEIRVPAKRQLILCKNPKILTIQLKRFKHVKNTPTKVQDLVSFPSQPSGLELNGSSYTLVSVNAHKGNVGSGHCYSRTRVNGNWIEFNDQTVGKLGGGGVEASSDAYILFYERVN